MYAKELQSLHTCGYTISTPMVPRNSCPHYPSPFYPGFASVRIDPVHTSISVNYTHKRSFCFPLLVGGLLIDPKETCAEEEDRAKGKTV